MPQKRLLGFFGNVSFIERAGFRGKNIQQTIVGWSDGRPLWTEANVSNGSVP